MRRLIVLGAVFLCGSVLFAETISSANVGDNQAAGLPFASLFRGDDTGYNWTRPITRGEARAIISRYEEQSVIPKVSNLERFVNNSISESEERSTQKVEAIKLPPDYTNEVAELQDQVKTLTDRLEQTTDRLEKTRDQVAYIAKIGKEDIHNAIRADGAQIAWDHPFWVRSSVLNATGANIQTLSIGYDFILEDFDYLGTISPTALYQNGAVYLGASGEIRWGKRN